MGANGKSALLGMKIWEEDVNAKGGLIGRQVKLVYYDDQSNPSTVPGLYAKLLDVDKVDMIVSGYATNMIAPAMPVAMQRKKVFPALFGTGVNSEFKYDKYFAMIPTGPDPKPAFTKPFFDVAMAQSPKPETISLAAADAEFGRNVCDGARQNAKAAGLKIVYDKTYPPPTTDFAPIIRAIQATNPDIAVFCSYPLNSVGLIRAINEIGFKAKIIGGAMVGIQATAIKRQLGPLLNGITNYETWVPAKTMEYPGVNEFLAKYQARAGSRGRRSARLLPRHLGLCLRAARSSRRSGCQQRRRREARRLFPHRDLQDHHGRREVRRPGRVGGVALHRRAVPRHQGQRARPVQGHERADHRRPASVRDRQADLPLREGEIAHAPVIPATRPG